MVEKENASIRIADFVWRYERARRINAEEITTTTWVASRRELVGKDLRKSRAAKVCWSMPEAFGV
ncbi:MAG: hypothetical protein H0X72_14575 [Acidobacteria bacterium]|nr:hypothetical protein [Acidobacteriota bacterium]